MKKIITATICIVVVALMNGCGATAPKTPYQPISAIVGKSRLYIYFECSATAGKPAVPI